MKLTKESSAQSEAYIMMCFVFQGYTFHLVSAFGEWFMALGFVLYFFTYIRDFQKFSLEVKTRLHVTHLDQVPAASPDEHTRLLI